MDLKSNWECIYYPLRSYHVTVHWYIMNNKKIFFFSNGLHRKFCIIWEGLCVILEEKKKPESVEEKPSFSKRLIMDLVLCQLVHGSAIN